MRQVDIVRHKNIFFQPQARIHAYLPAQMGPFLHDDALTQVRAFPQMDMVLQTAACLQTRFGPQHAARAGTATRCQRGIGKDEVPGADEDIPLPVGIRMDRTDQSEAQFPQGVVQQTAQFGSLLVRGRDHGPGEVGQGAGAPGPHHL